MDPTIKKILKPVPLETQGVCATCRFYRHKVGYSAVLAECLAVSNYADLARRGECQNGHLWEAKPKPVPVLVRLKRWLIG